MLKFRLLAVALAASTALATVAVAADQQAARTTVDRDFTQLSTAGQTAFQDVGLARLAIFDGHTDKAKTYIDQAKTAIGQAKTDRTVFMKAESDLKPPATTGNTSSSAMNSTSNTTSADETKTASADKTPVAWIPINGSVSIAEDYATSPSKSAGVDKANQHLKKGDMKQAMQALKLAEVDAVYVNELAPLDKTVNGIDQAAQLIDSGKYYQANQELKTVEDSVRFDTIHVFGLPENTASKQSAPEQTGKPATGSGSSSNTANTSGSTAAGK